jgi:hypothetical protein
MYSFPELLTISHDEAITSVAMPTEYLVEAVTMLEQQKADDSEGSVLDLIRTAVQVHCL